MIVLFESKERRLRDRREVTNLFDRFGEDTVAVLRERVADKNLSSRDRKHWRRILSKAKRYPHQQPEDAIAHSAY